MKRKIFLTLFLLIVISVYKISALNGDNTKELLEEIVSHLEVGPMYYPKDEVSDHPENFIIAEIIREKVLTLTTTTGSKLPFCFSRQPKY